MQSSGKLLLPSHVGYMALICHQWKLSALALGKDRRGTTGSQFHVIIHPNCGIRIRFMIKIRITVCPLSAVGLSDVPMPFQLLAFQTAPAGEPAEYMI